MLTLYYKPGCPFCNQVLATIDQLKLEDVEMKDVTSDEAIAAELIAIGGKKREPFLFDSDHDVKMYESDDIVAYLRKTYGNGDSAASGVRVHKSGLDSTCVSCEG